MARFIACLLLSVSFAGAAMAQGGTHDNTPGAPHHEEGNHAYAKGLYGAAMEHYKISARWADKISQYNIGVMYYLGQGTERDPATAWAWFALAAERGYPHMVKMADGAWKELDEAGRERAKSVHAGLLPEYGDEVTIERTARYMERERKRSTGSRTGFVGGMRVISRHMTEGMDEDGADFYAKERWDYRQIVDIERRVFDNLSRGRVEVGGLEVVEDTDDASDDEEP